VAPTSSLLAKPCDESPLLKAAMLIRVTNETSTISCFDVVNNETDDRAVKKHAQYHSADWYRNHF
jgi:hypothetical protein